MYRYDNYDQALVSERVAQFRDQVDAPPRRRADRGPVQAAAADERPLSAAARLHAARRHSLRHAVVAADAQAGPHRAHLRPGLRPFHHPPEHPVQLDQAGGDRRHPGAIWPRSRCTRSRPAAIASATSPPTSSPAQPPTRSRIRALLARSCASGRRFHPEFTFLPRKFKIAVIGSPSDRAAMQVHDIGLQHACATTAARSASRSMSAAAWAARRSSPRASASFLPKRHLLVLSRGDPARLQPLGRRDNIYKARIKILVHAVGADEVHRRWSKRSGSISAMATCDLPPAEIERIRAYLRAAGVQDLRRRAGRV